MQYIVRLGYENFKFESGQEALSFAETARKSHIDDDDRGYIVDVSVKSEDSTEEDD